MIKDIEDGMNFANVERESFKKSLQEMRSQLGQLEDKNPIWRYISRVKICASLE